MKNGIIRNLLMLVAILGVASCSTTADRWYLNGKTQADLDRADTECHYYAQNQIDGETTEDYAEYSASTGNYGALIAAIAVQSELAQSYYRQCMSRYGFTLVE